MRMGFISAAQCYELGQELRSSSYGTYLIDVAMRGAAAVGNSSP
jgi:glucose-1-phosphate thymidylyltransferase